MFGWLVQRWHNWISDRHLESAIRTECARSGLATPRAKISALRLEAIERPGWVQIWSFEVEAVYGAAYDDGRRSTQVLLTPHRDDRDAQLNAWSAGKLRRR